jgi:hypothetical protein
VKKLQTVNSCIIHDVCRIYSIFEAMGQAIWLKKFIPGLKVVDCIDKPLKMYHDNQPAVFYAHNNKSSKASRPIEVKYYVVKDKIQGHT